MGKGRVSMTEQDLEAYLARTGKRLAGAITVPAHRITPGAIPPNPAKKPDARDLGRGTNQSRMNKTEAAYAQILELRKRAGEILDYKFQAYKFRLAAKTYLTPDFMVINLDRTMDVHEVKGHWEEDARVKMKVAAELYPHHRWLAVKKHKGEFLREAFN